MSDDVNEDLEMLNEAILVKKADISVLANDLTVEVSRRIKVIDKMDILTPADKVLLIKAIDPVFLLTYYENTRNPQAYQIDKHVPIYDLAAKKTLTGIGKLKLYIIELKSTVEHIKDGHGILKKVIGISYDGRFATETIGTTDNLDDIDTVITLGFVEPSVIEEEFNIAKA